MRKILAAVLLAAIALPVWAISDEEFDTGAGWTTYTANSGVVTFTTDGIAYYARITAIGPTNGGGLEQEETQFDLGEEWQMEIDLLNTGNVLAGWRDGSDNNSTATTTYAGGATDTRTINNDDPNFRFVFAEKTGSVGGQIDIDFIRTTEITAPPSYTGNAGIISATRNSATSADLVWEAATDNVSPANDIVYNVYWDTNTANVISGGIDESFTGLTAGTINGLPAGQEVFFTVRAEDRVGNEETNVEQESIASTIPACLTYVVHLDGAQETPPVPTSGSGIAFVTLDTTANTLDYEIYFGNLTSAETIQHIHGFSARGVASGIQHNLPVGNPKFGTWNYNEVDEQNIIDGLTYFNIHSVNFGAGEIRGQIDGGLPCDSIIFAETWESVTPLPFAFGNGILIAGSDENFVTGPDSGSATPQGNVVIRSVASGVRMQRILPGGGPIAVFGNQGFAALTPTLDEDTVETVTLRAQVFVGGLTPSTGAQAATFATVVMAAGDSDYGRDEADVFGSAASLSWQLNNHVSGTFPSLPIPSPGSRLRVAINNADYDIITTINGEALLGAPVGSMTYARQGYAPLTIGPGPLVTQGNAAGQLYFVSVSFNKTNPLSTEISYELSPLAPFDAAAITAIGQATIPAAFPFNAEIDRVVVQMGSAMGFGDGADTTVPNSAPPGGDAGAFEGSWIDNIIVQVNGTVNNPPLSTIDWEVFE